MTLMLSVIRNEKPLRVVWFYLVTKVNEKIMIILVITWLASKSIGQPRNSRGPTVTSLEECASRKAFRVDHTPGSHSNTVASAGSRRPSLSSSENNFRRRYLKIIMFDV